jgi:ubiquinone/menaquinone biosynthesis C-methylase UbiE
LERVPFIASWKSAVSRAFFTTEKMDTPLSTFDFKRMALMLSLRDLFSGPRETLAKVGIQPGFLVLDYGCGTGSFTFEAAQRVGPEGKVYALDINPKDLEKVPQKPWKKDSRCYLKRPRCGPRWKNH